VEARSKDSAAVPARVLAVRLGAIGDVVNALVFAAALEEARPDVHIGWVVHPLAAPLVEGHPCVDRVHVWKRGGGLGELARLVREIRAERYDVAVDLQRIQKSAFPRAPGAPRVLGYDRAREGAVGCGPGSIAPRESARHMVQHYLEFARHLGAPASAPGTSSRPTRRRRSGPRSVRELGGEPVLVNLGATKPANRWMPSFGALARALARELGVPVCFTGGPTIAPRAEAARRGRRYGGWALVGATSLRQSSLARRSRLFVGCDGPDARRRGRGHAVRRALAPPTARTGPWARPPHRACRRARRNRKTCNQPRHACMEDITREHVLAAVRETLTRAREGEDPHA
jgi:ADP-heptose:LPS heptosyltransferase